MTKQPETPGLAPALPPNAASELAALRERIELQHTLLGLYARTHSNGGSTPRLELLEPMPPRLGDPAAGATRNGAHADVEPARSLLDVAPNEPWWPMPMQWARSLRPTPGWPAYSLAQSGVSVVGFSLIGLSPRLLSEAVDLVASVQLHQRNFIPVFFTDHADLAVFRANGFVVEYFPPLPDAMPEATTAKARQKRQDFLVRKWGIARVVEMGDGAGLEPFAEMGAIAFGPQVPVGAPSSTVSEPDPKP